MPDQSPLYIACQKNNVEEVRKLLATDIDINLKITKDTTVDTALLLVCRTGNLAILKLLLSHPKIEVNQTNEKGWTPFIVACMQPEKHVVNLLLKDKRIEVNPLCETLWPDLGNIRFLHKLAAKSKSDPNKASDWISIIHSIVSSGRVDVRQKDQKELTATEHAWQAKNYESLRPLLAYNLSYPTQTSMDSLANNIQQILPTLMHEKNNLDKLIKYLSKNSFDQDLKKMQKFTFSLKISDLFCLMILFRDEYVKLKDNQQLSSKIKRFFEIINHPDMHMDVLMVLANRCFNSAKNIVSPQQFEWAVQRFLSAPNDEKKLTLQPTPPSIYAPLSAK